MDREEKKTERGLKDYGIIYVSGQIDDKASEGVCKEIIELNISSKVDRIQLIINSSGGSCAAGFAIIDIMEWSSLPVYTTGVGMIASMGLLIFMTGAKGHRVITPRTSILSHRYFTIQGGNHSQLLAGRKEQDLMHKRIIEHYLRYSNVNSKEELERHLLKEVDTWLDSEEAVKFGIADIIEPLRERKNTGVAL